MEIYDFFTASGINNTFSGYGPHPFFCDYCPQLSDLPDGKVYSSATCFEDNEPFRTIKIWPGWQGGSGKVKICLRNGLKVWIQIPPRAPKWVKDPVYEMNSNQSRAVGGTIWVHFRVHWPIWGPLDSSKAKFRPFWGRFWPSLTPHDNSVKWSKMACTGVPLIVLHILCSTRTYWGHFRPCKVSFSAIVERSSLLLRQYELWKYCF